MLLKERKNENNLFIIPSIGFSVLYLLLISLSLFTDGVISKLNTYKEYFELDKYRKVTESQRPGKPKTITDIFGGVEGSFKKLEID